ncbi:MAG TPA: hypothetical protein VG929_11640 [Actinomycetota bacterium]|nr:hypothetical protein [Actinomycetota bacterium]
MSRTTYAEMLRDEHGIIVGWLGKLLIAFVLVGIVIFDGGAILINFFTLDSTADEIAIKLTTDSTQPLRVHDIEPQARTLAKEAGARLVSLSVDDNMIYLTLRRRATTLVVGRIGPIADWARATAEGQAAITAEG